MSDSYQRTQLQGFLEDVFRIWDPDALFRLILKSAKDPLNTCDLDVWLSLKHYIEESSGGLDFLSRKWNALKQLNKQKVELCRETKSVICRLGKLGILHDYVSIGDHGKLVLPLRETLGMKGRAIVVHDQHPCSESLDQALERGSIEPFPEFYGITYGEGMCTPKVFTGNRSGCV